MQTDRRGPVILALLAAGAVALAEVTPASRSLPAAAAVPRGAATLREAYRLVGTWDGSKGQSAPGAVLDPAGIDASDQGVVLVDRGNDRVQRFSPGGQFLAAWGASGSGVGELAAPRDVAVDGDRVYVTDTGNHRIAVYAGDGRPIETWTAAGLDAPWGIAARAGRVYVSDARSGEVVAFENGVVVARWAVGGEPRGISVGSDGRVYVAAHGASEIRIHQPDGRPAGSLPVRLAPIDVAVDHLGDLYVQSDAAVLWYPAGATASRQAMYYPGMQGLALSTRHGLYVSVARMGSSRDPQFHGVVRYRWQPQDGVPAAPAGESPQWSLLGFPPGRLRHPRSIHVGPSGRVWVVDAWPRLQAYDRDGHATRQVVPQDTGGLEAVDVAESPRGELLVGEARRLLRVSQSGVVTQTVRLGDATTGVWLTALAWRSDGTARVTVLDGATMRLRDYAVTRILTPIADRPLASPGVWALRWDLAVPDPNPGDTTYVVNRSARTVELYQRGATAGSWHVDGVPARVVADGTGSVYVLTVDGLVHKLSAQGEVIAEWDAAAFSAGGADVVDLAVDASGRVYTLDRVAETVRVWERDPGATPEPPASRGSACRVRGDKRAEPAAVRLGQPVTVRLQVGGECPSAAPRADIVLAIDRSASMNAGTKITDTRAAALLFVSAIDLARDRVGVVAFNSVARVVQPLTGDRAMAEAAIRGITAVGDTSIEAALSVSAAELTGTNGRADAQPVIVLLTDGRDREPDGALDAAATARDRGAKIFTIGFGDVDPMLMTLAATTPDHFYYAPDTSTLTAIYTEIARRITADVLALSMTVVDELPGDMRYVADSASPAATWEPAARTLTWQLSRVPFAGIGLSYAVEPAQLGRRATNIGASAHYVDGLSSPGSLRFPVPQIDVLDREPTATPTFTPFPTPTPRPTATPLPPEPLYLPLLLRQQCRGQTVHADVALVMDTSSSMSLEASPGGPTKMAVAIEAARVFVRLLTLPGDQAALISFDSDAVVRQTLTGDLDALLAAIGALEPGQGTRIDRGLQVATDEVTGSRSAAGNNRVIVLLTDGQNTGAPDSTVRERADEAKQRHVLIYTVGLGEDVDATLLAEVASHPEYAFRAPSASELAEIYRDIAYTIACPNLHWP